MKMRLTVTRCSIEVDSNGKHIGGQGKWGDCGEGCPFSDRDGANIFFFFFLNNEKNNLMLKINLTLNKLLVFVKLSNL
jgi:hypothetical protein